MVPVLPAARGFYSSFAKRKNGAIPPKWLNNYHSKVNYVDTPAKRPSLVVTERCVKNVLNGFPWIYSKDVKNADELTLYSPCIVNIKNEYDEQLGVGIYNKNSVIASRVLSTNINDCLNEEFFTSRIEKAYKKRLQLFPNDNFFRVVNAESDFLPGVIIDKFDKLLCVQINASGMDILLHSILKSIEKVLNPEIIILKNDSKIRKLEKLPLKKEVYKGIYNAPVEVRENGLTFFVDVLKGQKTGWYYDQRLNRAMLISYCKNKRVLDLFSYVGSFGITLAYYGAKEVTCVDSSYAAIQHGIKAAHYNGVMDKTNFVHSCVKKFLSLCLHAQVGFSSGHIDRADVHSRHHLLEASESGCPKSSCQENSASSSPTCSHLDQPPNGHMTNLSISQNDMHANVSPSAEDGEKLLSDVENIFIYGKSNVDTTDIEDVENLLIKSNRDEFFRKKYDVILVDPPALARNNYLLPAALKIYQKLLYISFRIVEKPGYVFVSSCNKLVGYEELLLCIRRSLHWSKCEGTIIGEGRISADHPVHVSLPETRYLTSVLLMVS
ncbi:S-adenosylmethionine-dependent methyltransferase, putative [Plasmodium knowlesi strain H]|uniref:S-adenosylmethionine-dependent methyltransferase, putative n=3 Tax=Plasmodium knowlesi TaxID=5850 RepID=A0A5K1VSI1_PLAKH|nr:S-adenosylmethionine-dependent methyltransferase, putative [Plasmodium knowlesi strain H]OTN65298.1 putative S-adenosylmethionine-dependent methyltransferase [Plasmodium knowlesi]CAA9989643.1 S-adenosylmethionine-dependent methyltransferase, putative [Plasmodium knowlesi strain H]SBO22747.1 S-adenosylmethionine-dependent methyltransferase, putative [Plasmodium knowlesi strain H]SBO23160.1 S-adenosylmethionine-dependent methyltransferase, putative [Plasmodium knowlesi strain H]VVS79117.1 S-a|eukprot:XP_002260367.1 hypothetical protein, conserved in Plasmodium species [Plasmodium knowlesi strain H]